MRQQNDVRAGTGGHEFTPGRRGYWAPWRLPATAPRVAV